MTRLLYVTLLSVVIAIAGCGGYTYTRNTDPETGSTTTNVWARSTPAAGCHLLTLSPGLQRIVGSYSVPEPVCYAFPAAESETQPLFHLTNPSTGDHLYTARSSEISEAVGWGYAFKDTCCYVYSGLGPGRVPLYRLSKQGTWCHFYTTSESVRDSLAAVHGYTAEGVACYVPADSLGGARVLYRMRQMSDRH